MTGKCLQNFEYYKISIFTYLEVFSSELSINRYLGLLLRVYVFTHINYLVNFVFDTRLSPFGEDLWGFGAEVWGLGIVYVTLELFFVENFS